MRVKLCPSDSRSRLKPEIQSEPKRRSWAWATLSLLVASAFSTVLIRSAGADPGLSVSLISSNQVRITVTNALAGETYVLYRRDDLNELQGTNDTRWKPVQIGAPGQTVFTNDFGIFLMGFLRTVSGTNWDADAAVNWIDADPLNSSIGALTVTIESPANGATIY